MVDDVAELSLSQGYVTIIDAADYDELSQFKWYYNASAGGYAARNIKLDNGKKSIELLHRRLNDTPVGFDTDHKNTDRLDNRRSNLRTATRQQNERNRSSMNANTSGCRGVSFDKSRGKWAAYIKFNYRKIHLGRYDTFEEAVAARQRGEATYNVW